MVRRNSVPARAARVLLSGVSLLFAAGLRAGPAEQFFEESLDTRAGWDVEADAAADGSATAKINGVAAGAAALRAANFGAVRAFAVAPGLSLDGGIRVSEVRLPASPQALLPAGLRANALVVGVSWKLDDAFGFTAQALPAFSGEAAGTDAHALNVSGVVSGFWRVGPHVVVQAGVEFDSLGQYTLYPTGGVVIDLARDWSLKLLFPQSRLVYQASRPLTLFLGANVEVQSYRMGGSFGTAVGVPRLNHAPLTLEETQFGPGAAYQFGPAATVELSLGAVTDRQFRLLSGRAGG